jgi:hypothetical protein
MSLKTLKINQIFQGHSPSLYFGGEGTYATSVAIDPDLPSLSTPILSTGVRTSGFIVPVGYAKFSGSLVNAPVIKLITNPKNTLTYAVLTNGRLISYNSSFASETLIASAFTVTIASPGVFSLTAHGLSAGDVVYFSTSGALPTGLTAGTAYYVIAAGLTADAFQVSTSAGGSAVNTSGSQSGTHSITIATSYAEYYNNYIYLFTGTNVSRYGPLNNTPVLTHSFWTTTLGEVALTNTTYPALRGVSIPNHFAHVHGDNSLYFGDFINGQGMIHRINTRKVTNEGDTDGSSVPSAYNVLDLPFGFYPTGIESSGTNLIILGIYTIDTTINQGDAAFVIWDPTNVTSWNIGPIFLPDPLATVVKNINGLINIWSGNNQNGLRISRYLGNGEAVKDLVYQEEGLPPLPGAVDALGNRMVWGGFTTNPAFYATVFAYGSKDARLPAGLHNIARGSSAFFTPLMTAVKFVEQSSNITPKMIIASTDSNGQQIDKYSNTANLGSLIRFMFNVGQSGQIRKIKLPLAGVVSTNVTIRVMVYFDDLSSSKTLALINNTNYPGKRGIIYKGTELKDYKFTNNFLLEILFDGTDPVPVALPITIEIETFDDEATA